MVYVLIAVLMACAYIPQWWVRHVMKRYSKEDASLRGTGGELAEHLLEQLQVKDMTVEQGEERQDHFDPTARAVRLSPSNFQGKSLTAIAVAAHEVGHAIQCDRHELIFRLRSKFIPIAIRLQQFGQIIMVVAPIVALVARTPAVFLIMLVASIVLQFVGALTYLIVLPEEWDASFNKALPILKEGNYIDPHQEPAIRRILRAAALTYFAAALASIVNLGRWAMLLKRR